MNAAPQHDPLPEYRYLQHGAVSLFLKPAVLQAAIAELQGYGYVANEIRSESEDTIYEDIGLAYDWPSLFGYHPPNNLDALRDGLTTGNGPKRLLVFRDFDLFHAVKADRAHTIMDVLEGAARFNLLCGERLAVFVQVADPRFELNDLGATSARWNPAEWLNKDRGL